MGSHLGVIIKHPLEKYPFLIDYSDRLPAVHVQSAAYTSTTISVNGDTETFSDSAASMPSAVLGDILVVSGASNSANNGTFLVGNRSASAITPQASNLVTEASGASITLTIMKPAQVTSGVLSAVRESDGADVTNTVLASASAAVFDSGRKMSLTAQAGTDGEQYTVTIQANLNTGTGHNFVDTMTIFVRSRADR